MAGSKSIFDMAKDLAREVGGKAKDTVTANADKIDDSIDKTAEFVDTKTKGKYTKHVDKAQKAAHGAVEKISDRPDEGKPPTDDTTPPPA